MGYHLAGFTVVGVDHRPMPGYPFEHHQADALEYLEAHGHEFDAIHASPPCQFATAYRRKGHGVGATAVNLIPQTRDLLEQTGRPYIIENVEQAAEHLRNPFTLCGSAFGLDVERHRLFEAPSLSLLIPPCDHTWWTPRFPPATNRTNLRRTVEVGVWRIPLETQQRAMGIDWMQLGELSQAIPPAYTRFLGEALLGEVARCAA
jgi:DNA (cytosine-5)-methyltransferase 1